MTIILKERKIVCAMTREAEVEMNKEYDNHWVENDFAILWKKDKEDRMLKAVKAMLNPRYKGFWKKKELKKKRCDEK